MNKFFSLCILAAALVIVGCTGRDNGMCYIHGTISNKYDGKKIFMKPFQGLSKSETVDSVVIKDGKFEFESDTAQMKVVLLDYHYRMGTENLLVITEPGDVYLEIGETSRSWGTPQNDSLQQWKERKQAFDMQFMEMMRETERLKKEGQTAKSDSLLDEAKALRKTFNGFSRRLAANAKEGVLHDFLTPMFPLTYKRMLPDSTIVEYDFDTNEPVGK